MPNHVPDFEADVRFLREPVRQGYRCDIHWDDDASDLLWMIWPMFLDDYGQELPEGAVVPQVSRAHFYIINAELKDAVHRQWLREGAGFHLCEGAHKVAACRITAVFTRHENAI
jgi:hypothetical protein